MEFTLEGYKSVLQRLKDEGYGWGLFDGKPEGKKVYLRHDVDLFTDGVIPMAQAERELGFTSTYFFLSSSAAYNLLERETMKVVRGVTALGHKAALHIDASVYNEYEELAADVLRRYDFFSAYFTLEKAVSWHRPSRLALESPAPQGFTCTYGDRYFKDIMYVSDANRRKFWQEERMNEAIAKSMPIQFLTHPLWWHKTEMEADVLLEKYAEWQKGIAKEYLGETFKVFKALLEEQGFGGRDIP